MTSESVYQPYHNQRLNNQKSADVAPPVFRRLRGYAFDPSLSTQMETAVVNEIVFKVPWERNLRRGPVGEYLEVVDFDPASRCFYAPVNLNDPYVLAQDGLEPCEGGPQFHQQMVYAVAMTTIHNFERALGRWALWSPPKYDPRGDAKSVNYVKRLRIYPHAFRGANAYYSPQKKALLFGYFPASSNDPGNHVPGGTVFTCLSHDIVAHETTHALLDGMHRRFIEATHPDSLAFHEAFADIVALFQHFTFPEVLRQQIAKTRGNLAQQSLLGELAQEFGQATGRYGALRDAIGHINPETKQWESLIPEPNEYQTVFEPHKRGAILVAAVFDAFLSIYKSRVEDLLRIATSGTGILPAGALHPDLVNRLADEAAKSARHVLHACIRALDYCPPVDITFGDYLRAIITADYDLVPDDYRRYRIAFIEAFRRRGIYPQDIRILSVDSLRWEVVRAEDYRELFLPIAQQLLIAFTEQARYFTKREKVYKKTNEICAELHTLIKNTLKQADYHANVTKPDRLVTGLVLTKDNPHLSATQLEQFKHDEDGNPLFEVHALRSAQRVGPDGDVLNQLIISLTQQRTVPIDGTDHKMTFRGGCTLILDLKTFRVQYCIMKSIVDDQRLERQKKYVRNRLGSSLQATYFNRYCDEEIAEPFALLHREL